MDGFMSTYEINMKEEKNRVKNLESDIVFSLEHMSSNIDQLNFDEIDSLKLKNGTHNSLEVDSNKTVDALIKDYERQKAQLKKVIIKLYYVNSSSSYSSHIIYLFN